MSAFFVAGTDTEVGKTWVSSAILASAAEAGISSLGLKPVAAGAEWRDGQWQNDDALALMQASSIKLSYSQINPLCLPEPMAPHLAAERAGQLIDLATLVASVQQARSTAAAELTLVEGAGGWRVPLARGVSMADLAKDLSMPVILVVGMRLGCLNHALLTVEAIRADGLNLAGWVANDVDPEMSCLDENISTLRRLITAPLLARVKRGQARIDIREMLQKVSS